MTTTYRYLFADLLTNSIIAELPLTGVAFGSQLNQAGTFQGHVLLSGKRRMRQQDQMPELGREESVLNL